MRAKALIGALMLTGCGESDAGSGPSFKDIGNGQMFSMIAPADVPADQLLTDARKHCEGKTHCQVLAWTDPAKAATAMPMLDRESESVVFSYQLNRSTGHERALWDCKKFERPKDECLDS